LKREGVVLCGLSRDDQQDDQQAIQTGTSASDGRFRRQEEEVEVEEE